jgi:hypothetical protein
VLVKNQDTRFRMCQMLANCIEEWTWKVVKEKVRRIEERGANNVSIGDERTVGFVGLMSFA